MLFNEFVNILYSLYKCYFEIVVVIVFYLGIGVFKVFLLNILFGKKN